MTGGKWTKQQWSGPFSFTPAFLVRSFNVQVPYIHLKFHFQHWLNNLPMENGKRERHKVLCEHTNFVEVWHYIVNFFYLFFFLSLIGHGSCIYWDSFFSMLTVDINWLDKRRQRSLLDKLNMFGSFWRTDNRGSEHLSMLQIMWTLGPDSDQSSRHKTLRSCCSLLWKSGEEHLRIQ